MYNVMIVDDEPVIRNGLISFVNWEALDCKVVCEASNGIEASEKLGSTNIDILITDLKMPGMDGIELSKYVYENYPNIKTIILTAFPDFSYAQSAIKYNVVDFIVKIDPSEKVPEAVTKAKKLIVQRKISEAKMKLMEDTMSENLSEIREKFIKDILNGIIIIPEIINSQFETCKIALDHYFIITYEINSLLEEDSLTSPDEHNKFIFSIKNFLSLVFKDYQHYTFIMNKNLLVTIVTMNENNPSIGTQTLLIICNEILGLVDSFVKFNLNIGISGMHISPLELPLAYNEGQAALSSNFFNNNNISLYTSKSGIQSGNKSVETYKYNDDILINIQKGNVEAANSCLLELFDQYKVKENSVEQLKVSSMLLCLLCYRLLANYKLDISEFAERESEVYRQIQESKSIQNIFNILTRIIKTISDIIISNKKQCNYLVKEVNKYIRDNYNKDISLKSISDYVHVNSSYLSRLYKKETDESIIDALNKLRIEKAKSLLLDPGKKIFEVASEVGIEDAAYFTHVFKKYTGVSPKEFKAQT